MSQQTLRTKSGPSDVSTEVLEYEVQTENTRITFDKASGAVVVHIAPGLSQTISKGESQGPTLIDLLSRLAKGTVIRKGQTIRQRSHRELVLEAIERGHPVQYGRTKGRDTTSEPQLSPADMEKLLDII